MMIYMMYDTYRYVHLPQDPSRLSFLYNAALFQPTGVQ